MPIDKHAASHISLDGAYEVLFDNRAFVRICCDVMRCSADQLYPFSNACLQGFAPLKLGRNEWWMLIIRPEKALAYFAQQKPAIGLSLQG
jgi:hypothetical protein